MALTRSMLAAVAIAALLGGCGTPGGLMPAMRTAPGQMQAESTAGLEAGFTRIHQAIFNKLDANHDGFIDEYEAGPTLNMDDFQRADVNHDGKLSYQEFLNYSVKYLFFFHTTAQQFEANFRKELYDAFQRLDVDHDGLLSQDELTTPALVRLHLSFEYPKLNISIPIVDASSDAFMAADKTGDGKLSQAEFEDWYIDQVVQALGGDPAPAPSSDPGPAPSDAPAPAPGPAQNLKQHW